MSIARSAMVTKVRARLFDKTTRRDGTAISTPFYSNAEIQTAVNNAIRERQPLIAQLDETWYRSTFDFVGQTDAIAASSSTTLPVVANEQYSFPSNFKQFTRLARRDLPNYPTVRVLPAEQQDQYIQSAIGLFSGLSTESFTHETCAMVTYNSGGTLTNRLRIRPAPPATSYTYRLFFTRTPTEPTDDAHTLDIPPDWIEVVALDAAVELAAAVNAKILPTLTRQRDISLQARYDDHHHRFSGRRFMPPARP